MWSDKLNPCLLAAIIFPVSVVPLTSGQQVFDAPVATAKEHLVKTVEPVYPPLAKLTKLQGTVVLEIRIDEAGEVSDVKVQSGPPLLVPAAVRAVKQWRYKPFTEDGKPVEAETTIEVPFSLGIPDAEYKKQQEINNQFFKQDDRCRGLVSSHNYEEAETACREGVALAEELPPERGLERSGAYAMLGWAFMGERKFPEALDYFQQEVRTDEKVRQPYDADRGYGYHNLALALLATGDLKGAVGYYQRSIKTLELAREHMPSAGVGDRLKSKYASSLKAELQEYAKLLKATGDPEGAAAAEQQADSLP